MDHDSVLHSITTGAIDKVVNTYPQNRQRKVDSCLQDPQDVCRVEPDGTPFEGNDAAGYQKMRGNQKHFFVRRPPFAIGLLGFGCG